ncbi:Exodeoxyribonuclease VII small subunit [Lampropedia hyalina DSM 16112]|jgi:exodeoxyribonuclease VII small subunit|uniref:Exodeoxyribonuclease 7 small subunit n=1 Tax=Lampropedia hyalina DSM 16112 TaxID=1122156 RepID=A0A1M4ZYM4_9BURK|nr:exodeoxyribonuclease VII small subunit [Lampropedia hyalina]SHF23108.1 Exodeoxyribonuclease VII small subunit [Lampropedia hyalina DSM 16112]
MPARTPKNTPATYEDAMQELEQLLAQIEGGRLPLEQLLSGYQRGTELLNFCRARLQAVQEQIQTLEAD